MNTLSNRFFVQMLKPIVTLFLLPALFALTGKFAFAQNVGIGASSFTPDAQAMLEIRSTTSGLLIPRMTAAERAAISAGAGSDYGLLVYQIDGVAGYYYWDGAAWQIITSATTAWSLTGNASTNPASNYVGTSDAVELVLGTSGTPRLRIASSGNTAVGTTASNTYQFYSSTSDDGERAVGGLNTSTGTGNQYGVYGSKSGATGTGTGYGTAGSATGTGANNYGLHGAASGGTVNSAVYGIASGALGNNFGADISNTSTLAASTQYGTRSTKTGNLGAGTGIGYGVSGSASGTGLTNYGVHGTADGASNAYGVYGYANNGTVNNYGVYGTTNSTTNGIGVLGEANSVGNNVGVKGVATNATVNNFAIRGEATGTALFGGNYGVESSASGGPVNYGIFTTVSGATGNGFGGYFNNTQSTAASSQYGVQIIKAGNLGAGTGSGYGVHSTVSGTGLNNYGLWATASGATNNYGLFVNAGETKITDAGAALPARTANGSIATSTNGGNRIYFRTNGTNYYVDASGPGDYSEYFRNSDPTLTIGEIVCIDPNNHNGVQKAEYNSDGDVRRVGVISKYGTRNNDNNDGQRYADNAFVNIGLLGQLQVRVSDENGSIKPGDALTLSTTNPGIAVKATEEGRIIGYAMTHYPYVKGEITYPTHTGTKGEADILDVPHVMAFVQPGYYKPKKQVIKQ